MVYIFKMIGVEGNHLGEYASFAESQIQAELDIKVRYMLPQEVKLKLLVTLQDRRGVNRRK